MTIRTLDEKDLARGFRDLGLEAGMGLMVHASLKSLGPTADGPGTVVSALTEVLADRGTLMLPSFNHRKPFKPGRERIYVPTETETTDGAIAGYFWRQPGVLRSLNPTHPFAARGRDARRFLKDHHRTITMGPESPLGRLWRSGGYCLLLGVNYRPNTFHHVVEMVRKVPCLGVRTDAHPMRLPGGRTVAGRTWSGREGRCPILERAEYVDREMKKRGLDRRGRVGRADCILFKLQDCYGVISELFAGREGKPSPCEHCAVRQRRTEWTVESDWDFENDCLRPDSEAWSYEDGL